jgi:biotin synthase
MVFAGRGPSTRRTEQLASIVRKIKSQYKIEVCVSAGLLDDDKARVLKQAGVDRYNHNLNTASDHYAQICSTHSYEDRLTTLQAAKRQGLELCSGLIVGMGETATQIVEVAEALRALKAKSIPVNFLLPFDGTPISTHALTPEYCLRVLCLFRFVQPAAELRISAGREFHLRTQQPLALYAANSLFLEGYLNSKGSEARETLRMIQDAGFHIVSDVNIEQLLAEPQSLHKADLHRLPVLKGEHELRPTLR